MNVYQVSMVYGEGDGYAVTDTIGIWEKLDKAIEDNKNAIEEKLDERVKSATKGFEEQQKERAEKAKEGITISGGRNYEMRMKREFHLNLVAEASEENNYIVVRKIGEPRGFFECNYSKIGGILIQEIELK